MPISVAIANRQRCLAVDRGLVRRAVVQALAAAGIAEGEISVAIVDDEAIAEVHAEFLDDPTPTDVISFVLESSPGSIEGEIVASAETAERVAPRYEWSASCELLLYVVHGALHLVGYDDTTPAARRIMRRREREVLTSIGIRMVPSTRR